jgi:uncharacterized protein YjiS (DUF1127 family)
MSKLALSLDLQKKAAFRDSHIVILIVEALASMWVSFKQWRNRRRTLKVLADLDDHQLRDIGLTRGGTQEVCHRALAALDDADLVHLSDVGRQMRHQARHTYRRRTS